MLVGISTSLQAQDESQFNIGQGNKAGSYTWSGNVLSTDGEDIIGATIRTIDTVHVAYSDVDGSFSLQLNKGNYTFQASALGFATREFEINMKSSGSQNIIMAPANVIIEGVTISSQAENQSIKEIVPGLKRLDIADLEIQSKFFGEVDVLRSIQSLPGVNNVGEGSSGFNVRGGNADQNLIYQDGHFIFNPSHALGFFSLFHPDLVNYIDLYKTGLPPKFGGRLSSALKVQTKDGDLQKLKFKAGLGVVSSRLSVEGPILKDKISFIIGARTSYANWIFGLVDNPVLSQSEAYFGDVTAKISGRITPTTSFSTSYLQTKDDFQFGDETRFEYGTQSVDFILKQLIGQKANISLTANRGTYQSSLFDLKGNDQSKFSNQIDYTRGNADFLYQPSEIYKLNVGAEALLYDVAPGEVDPIGDSFIKSDQLPNEQSLEVSYYMEHQVTLFDKLDIAAGIRFTDYKNFGESTVYLYEEGGFLEPDFLVDSLLFGNQETVANYQTWAPRLSMRYEVNPSASIKLAYSKTNQFIAQISNTASATPIDVWQLSNYHFAPQSSQNYSLGFYKNFSEDLYVSSFEVFYRDLDNVVDYKDFARLLLNDALETGVVFGEALAYGAEFNFKKTKGTHQWDLNYTYSRSLVQIEATEIQPAINRGEWYSSNYDIPHVLNVNWNWNLRPKHSLSTNFTYRKGRPTTAPVSSFNGDNVLNVPIYSDRNQFRVPDFHRLDLAYTYGPFGNPNKDFKHSITVSIYNLYGRKNPYSVFFRQSPFDNVMAIRVAPLGTIFPSITYNINFR